MVYPMSSCVSWFSVTNPIGANTIALAPSVTRFLAAWSTSGVVHLPGTGWFIQAGVTSG